MADYIRRIRTENGDMQIDYTALANLPVSDTKLTESGSFADAKVVGDQIRNINTSINNLNDNSVSKSTTINGKSLGSNITLSYEDIDAASETHKHNASTDITSGALPMSRGGTEAENGSDGLKNLLASGHMILSSYQYGDSVPPIPENSEDKRKMTGRIFFVKVQ